ncbi:uncharacterized protein Dmoj_GI25829 [Drosophila mojavensis]|uniref:Uncharacterized protein n=1 Tax=Drosophila mojavensis TaxID=7230 RepID=A0A0Q9XJ97_DROMO|nr:uncharacterized protein Dmoj_GI25829 [Drosophila mojavensis]
MFREHPNRPSKVLVLFLFTLAIILKLAIIIMEFAM